MNPLHDKLFIDLGMQLINDRETRRSIDVATWPTAAHHLIISVVTTNSAAKKSLHHFTIDTRSVRSSPM